MIEDTTAHRVVVRVLIEIFSNIGPCSLGYVLWSLQHGRAVWQHPSPWRIWVAAESCFFCFMLWYRVYLQRAAVHPPLRSAEERHALFCKVRSEIRDQKRFLSGWFRGAKIEDIGRDELKAFLDWCFWDGRFTDADEAQMEHFMAVVESQSDVEFAKGPGKAKSLRLTLDPIEMDTRSLAWYSLMMLVDTITSIALLLMGFSHYRYSSLHNFVFPPRPMTYLGYSSPAKNIGYWYRPHTSKTRKPIIYLHGIGIGLITQLEFFKELIQASASDNADDGQVGILAIETLPISSRLTKQIIHREEFLDQVKTIVDYHKFDRFVLSSHSYGSILTTHILYDQDLASRVSAALFIDPVTINLHLPDVAYNFTVRPPKGANEWELWYFASKDPGVAHTLGRHFFWTENLLWRDHIMNLTNQQGMKITVCLAEKDLIVDTLSVGRYLANDDVGNPRIVENGNIRMKQEYPHAVSDSWQQHKWTGQGLDIMWLSGLDHAQVFDHAKTRASLIDVLREYSSSS